MVRCFASYMHGIAVKQLPPKLHACRSAYGVCLTSLRSRLVNVGKHVAYPLRDLSSKRSSSRPLTTRASSQLQITNKSLLSAAHALFARCEGCCSNQSDREIFRIWTGAQWAERLVKSAIQALQALPLPRQVWFLISFRY